MRELQMCLGAAEALRSLKEVEISRRLAEFEIAYRKRGSRRDMWNSAIESIERVKDAYPNQLPIVAKLFGSAILPRLLVATYYAKDPKNIPAFSPRCLRRFRRMSPITIRQLKI